MKQLSHLAAALAVAACPVVTQANVLEDGSFDLVTPGSQTSNSAWALTVNMPDGMGTAAQFQNAPWSSNDPGPPTHGVWLKAFEGAQAMGDPLAQADLSQSQAVAGGDYQLWFDARRETNFSAGEWSVTVSSSGSGGSSTIDLLADAPNDGGWYTYHTTLPGVGAGDTLTVRAVMVDGQDAGSNPQSAMMDNFVLRIPEPMSFALCGAGLLGLLCFSRRR